MHYLIVGQGLAGSLLAHRLEEQGISFKIIDSGVNESSRVAAGIINPIVFRRVTTSWMVNEAMDEALSYYSHLESKLGVKFLFSRTIRRAFSSQQEIDFWKKKSQTPEFAEYLSHPDETKDIPDYLNAPFGNGLVNSVYYVETKAFVDANTAYFKEKEVLIQRDFDYALISENGCDIDGEHFDKVVFCEGYRGIHNPFFKELPLTATKGQLLDLKIEGLINKQEILNRKCFLLQMEDGSFKSGATYEWDSPNTITTEEARIDLSEKIGQLINLDFEITGQEAGVRPTTLDRRPLMGEHKEHKGIYIFNGLGAKGYLLAPLLSKIMANSLVFSNPISEEMNITRLG